jgi:hypothetical protein
MTTFTINFDNYQLQADLSKEFYRVYFRIVNRTDGNILDIRAANITSGITDWKVTQQITLPITTRDFTSNVNDNAISFSNDIEIYIDSQKYNIKQIYSCHPNILNYILDIIKRNGEMNIIASATINPDGTWSIDGERTHRRQNCVIM